MMGAVDDEKWPSGYMRPGYHARQAAEAARDAERWAERRRRDAEERDRAARRARIAAVVAEVEQAAEEVEQAAEWLRAATSEAVDHGAPVAVVARAAGVGRQTVYRWHGDYHREAS